MTILSLCFLLIVIALCSAFYYPSIQSGKKIKLRLEMQRNDAEAYITILNRKALHLVDKSYENFKEGVNLGSNNPKEQMGTWVNRELYHDLIETFNNSKFNLDTYNNNSQYFNLFNYSDEISWSSLSDHDDKFSISLFHLPLNSYMIRRHDPGTILLIKSLFGSGRINSYVSNRLIQSELLETNLNGLTTAKVSSDVISRIGGPYRIFQSQPYLYSSEYTNCTIFLEIAIFPPSHLREEGNNESKDSNNYFILDYEPNHIENNIDIFADSDSVKEKLRIKRIFPTKQVIDNVLIRKSNNNFDISSNETLSKLNDYDSVYSKLNMNIGGLSAELKELIRRILLTRKLDSNLLNTIGLRHVRGLLLHGPPGTGKTLIAREIAKILGARPPKIVNGPEILDKFIGEAEKNIRDLFHDAENEYKLFGMRSQLHVIIFDEIDSLAKKRGNLLGDGSGTRDSVCNQLLAKLDGINELNNILVIGLTNRIDLIDDALLRPGRLEVHIQINAPNKQGRKEILYINFKPMVRNGLILPQDAEKFINIIAAKTRGYTGAELTGLIRSALSFALDRSDVTDNSFDLKLNWDDFRRAIFETKKSKSKYAWVEKMRNLKNQLSNYVQDLIPGETSETFTWN